MQQALATRRLTSVLSLLLCGILAGVVVAAAAFPLVGSAGLSAKAASDSFQDLPSELKTGPTPLTTTVRAVDGSYIASFYEQNRVDVPLKDIPKVMQDAIIAVEDSRFYEHQGVDAQGVLRALVANLEGGEVSQGASTLTQQYVKQAQYYSATTEEEREAIIAPTAARKLQEMRYAIALEKELSKDEILRRYLNISAFGANVYGVAAASQSYFSKPPSKLTLAEAAMIAGIVKNPPAYDPINGDVKETTGRRNIVLDRMVATGKITEAEAAEAKKVKIEDTLKPRAASRNCENGNPNYGFFCGWFLDWWNSNPAFGKTRAEREANLYRGGYNIQTSLDPKMQKAAQDSIDEQLARNNKFATGLVLIEPGTGRVKAMAINRNYGVKAPATTVPLLTGSDTAPGYQAGSTFKMFTMLAALEQGLPLSTKFNSPYEYKSQYDAGAYKPRNANRAMTGVHTMWSAFGESVNTYFIQLQETVGVDNVVKMAERLGIKFREQQEDVPNREAALEDPQNSWGSFTLGISQTTPLEVANAYATVAARGKYCEPLPLQSIKDRDGKPLPFADPKCKQVLDPQLADAATDAARCPVGGEARDTCSKNSGRTAGGVQDTVGRPIAGKTGTTDKNYAGWFAAFTPNLAGAGFIANPASANDEVPDGQIPVYTVAETMAAAVKLLPTRQFTPPVEKYMRGVSVTVPFVDGDSVADATKTLTGAGFKPRVSPTRVNSEFPEGAVAYTDPRGGSNGSKGGVVNIYVSNGVPPPKPTPTPTPSGSASPRGGNNDDDDDDERGGTTPGTFSPGTSVPPGPR